MPREGVLRDEKKYVVVSRNLWGAFLLPGGEGAPKGRMRGYDAGREVRRSVGGYRLAS